MTVSWLEAAPAAVAAMFWLVGAGVPACYALGLRGIAAWCVAPVMPPAIFGAAAVLARWLNVAWSPVTAVVAMVVVAIPSVGVGGRLRRQLGSPASDPTPIKMTAVFGSIAAVLLGAAITARGLGAPASVAWTWDTPFHYSALAYIRDSGNGSSLTLGTLGDPQAVVSFYPAGWFDIAALVPQTAGSAIPIAANAVTGVTAALVWPLACLFLARQVFGPKPLPLAVTGVLALGFDQFPWKLLAWGALWPYALGQALVPIGLGLVLSVIRMATEDTVGSGRAALLLMAAVAGIGFAHPAAVFGLGVLALFPIGWSLGRWSSREHRAGRSWRATARVSVSVLLVIAAVVGAGSTSLVERMRGTDWPPTHTAAAALGEVLLNATNSNRALWALSAVVVIGAIVFGRSAAHRWIVAAHLGSGLLYIMSASIQSPTTTRLTAFWFNDSHRLAAMLAVTAPLMATAGFVWITQQLDSADWFRKASDRVVALRPRPTIRHFGAVAPVLVVGFALLATTKGLYEGRNALVIHEVHKTPPDRAAKLPFYRQVQQKVPPHIVIANNPEDGSPLLWAIERRHVLLPHLTANHSPDRAYLAQRLTHAATDPKACQIARNLHVGYLITDQTLSGDRRGEYPGLQDYPGMRGYQLVLSNGPMKLYRLTTCPTARPSSPPAPTP